MIERTQFTTKRDFFNALLENDNQLSAHLQKNSLLLMETDEDQRTLLHRTIERFRPNQLQLLAIMLPFITKAALEIADKKVKTPVHEAANPEWYLCREQPHDCRVNIIPIILKKANDVGYDFSLEDDQGNTPLAILMSSAHLDGHIDMVSYFKQYVPNFEVNKINKHGISLLGIAVSKGSIEDADALLRLGADPRAHREAYYRSDTFALLAERMREIHRRWAERAEDLYQDRQRAAYSPKFFSVPDWKVESVKHYEDLHNELQKLYVRMTLPCQANTTRPQI